MTPQSSERREAGKPLGAAHVRACAVFSTFLRARRRALREAHEAFERSLGYHAAASIHPVETTTSCCLLRLLSVRPRPPSAPSMAELEAFS
eukprot:tig00000282_g23839.t1